MRGLVFPGDRRAHIASFPDPRPGPGEVVIQIGASAVCGSDMHGYRQSVAEREANGLAGTIPGHEPAGIVHELGEGVTNVKVGDRVAVYHYLGCGHCQDCRSGDLMWCDERRGYGGAVHGPNADLLLADARNCLPLPDSTSFALGAMLMCVGGTAYQVATKLDARIGTPLAVFGLGPIGLASMLYMQAMGADVIGVDMSPYRLELASKLGARQVVDAANQDVATAIRDFAGKDGVRGALESSGSAVAQATAVDVVGRRGKVAFVGFGSSTPSITPSKFIDRQLTLLGSFVFPINIYEDILGFTQRYDVPLESMVTHTVSLEDSPEILPAFDRGETGKVIIVP